MGLGNPLEGLLAELREEHLAQEASRQQEAAARALATLATRRQEAERFLAQLAPTSELGRFLDELTSEFPSRVEAAMHYLENLRAVQEER